MRFEWDKEKAEYNLRKHGVSFEEAVASFHDPFATTFEDPDHSVGEIRLVTVGYSSTRERLLVISHTERGDTVRIISARITTTHERKHHENQNPKSGR